MFFGYSLFSDAGGVLKGLEPKPPYPQCANVVLKYYMSRLRDGGDVRGTRFARVGRDGGRGRARVNARRVTRGRGRLLDGAQYQLEIEGRGQADAAGFVQIDAAQVENARIVLADTGTDHHVLIEEVLDV